MRPEGDYTTRVERGLPPEVRPVERPSAGFWETTLRLLSSLPFAGLAVYGGSLAAKDPEPLASALFAGLAFVPAWLFAASVGRTLRMYRGSELASLLGKALFGVGLLVGLAAAGLAVLFALMRPHMRICHEGGSKGNLGAIRSSLSIYYGDMEGYYPLTPYALTVSGKYMSTIPKTKDVGPHPDSAGVTYGSVSNDAGGWLYANDPADKAHYGTLWVNCTHTDAKGAAWTTY